MSLTVLGWLLFGASIWALLFFAAWAAVAANHLRRARRFPMRKS